jgi:hypothetical protein
VSATKTEIIHRIGFTLVNLRHWVFTLTTRTVLIKVAQYKWFANGKTFVYNFEESFHFVSKCARFAFHIMFKNLLICSINYLMSFGVLFMNSFPLQVIFPFGSNSKVLFFLLSTSGLVSENKIFFRSGLMSWVNKLLIVLGKMLISSLVNRLNVIKYNVHRLNDATAFNADDKFLFF